MANKALEILRKTEHDLDIEIKMWKNQGRPEVAAICKIEKAQVKQAIEKLCVGETLNEKGALPIPDVRVSTSYILCAAIWLKDGNKYSHQPRNVDSGLVVCGRRHHNCFLTAFELNGGKKIEGLTEVNGIAVQGFLTSDDRFVDRKEGGKIAFNAGQTSKLTECLFSEDLY